MFLKILISSRVIESTKYPTTHPLIPGQIFVQWDKGLCDWSTKEPLNSTNAFSWGRQTWYPFSISKLVVRRSDEEVRWAVVCESGVTKPESMSTPKRRGSLLSRRSKMAFRQNSITRRIQNHFQRSHTLRLAMSSEVAGAAGSLLDLSGGYHGYLNHTQEPEHIRALAIAQEVRLQRPCEWIFALSSLWRTGNSQTTTFTSVSISNWGHQDA
jgi:hypothetical protein